MNYVEIVNRQSVLEAEMMGRQEELQSLQQQRIACAQKHEDLATDLDLTSGGSVGLDLNYDSKESNIFTMRFGYDFVSFSPEDYNEMSNFFSKYNDAIFSYMSEIRKVEEDAVESED